MNSNSSFFDDLLYNSKSLTDFDVKEIKLMLLSGNKDQIMKCVEKIKLYLADNDSLVHLISSEIPEFLCDAIKPYDEIICRAVYACLEIIVQHAEFFNQKHSCFVIESLVRSIHFLLKNYCTNSTLSQSINLLILITKGYNTFDSIPEEKTEENLYNLISVLLESKINTFKNKYQIGCIIKNLVDLNLTVMNPLTFGSVLKVFSVWIDTVNEIFYSEHPIKKNLMSLCCSLSHSFLKLIISKETPFSLVEENNFFCDNEKFEESLIIKIINFLLHIVTPYFHTLTLDAIKSETKELEYFFQILLYFYRDEILTDKENLTQRLCENEFLQFLTRVISFADVKDGHHLRKLGVFLLSHIVFNLSETYFEINNFWPKGLENFRNEIQRGFLELPLDASQWLDVLISFNSSTLCKIALLLYLYFYCVTTGRQNHLEIIYPSIVAFINVSTGLESSVLLVRVTWLVYVMAHLSTNQCSLSPIDLEAKYKMLTILEAQNNLDLSYTHHPAILYWAFSSDISSSIQLKIVHLWLRNKSPDCKELDELIKKSPDVRCAILDILRNECGQVLDSAFLTLHSILMECEDENLILSIWFLLPQILAKFATDFASAKNVNYIIELCSVKAPESFDVNKLIRVASLLPKVLNGSNLIPSNSVFTLTLSLLELGFRMNDSRIFQVFFRFNEFLQKILEGTQSSVPANSSTCFKIVTILWHNDFKYDKIETFRKVKLNKETLLKPLQSNSAEIISAALNLLNEILQTGFHCVTFEIDEVNSDFIEILFFEVQELCIKGISGIPSICWRCLKSFLLLGTTEEKYKKLETMADPLTHELINFYLPRLQEFPDMKDFLLVWLEQNNLKINDCFFNRKIFGKFFKKTLNRLADQLQKNPREEDKLLYDKILQCGYYENM